MATIIRTVHWTFLSSPEAALPLLGAAVEKTDFSVVSATSGSIVIDVPRAMMKNRWAATITGTITATATGAEILWAVDGLGNKHYEHLVTIAKGLPKGSLCDHGIPEAVSKVALKTFGRKEIRHLANILDRGEKVHAIGVGVLSTKIGIVALTDRRLLFFEKSPITEDLVDFSLNSIGAMSLGKKIGGETLTITHSGTSAFITTLGPGQGDGIARKFHELKDKPATSTADTPRVSDPIEQIKRLSELRDKGILSEEEFQQQKAQLLTRM